MHKYDNERCIAIGASWGGVTTILRLVATLPAQFPVPIFVVQHIGVHASHLDQLISRAGPNPGRFPRDGERADAGVIYIAPPDRHMVVEEGVIRLLSGPKENHARPSIDPLLRSAALTYRERCIGVILTGMLDDGTAGLHAVKQCGGVTVVQDPADAEASGMPESAIANVQVDHIAAIDTMGALLARLAHTAPERITGPAPERVRREYAVTREHDILENLRDISRPSALTCPDCGGALFELDDPRPIRFRCHVGHAYTLGSLAEVQAAAAEEVLWSALRALNEKAMIMRRSAAEIAGSHPADADKVRRVADKLSAASQHLRELIEDAGD